MCNNVYNGDCENNQGFGVVVEMLRGSPRPRNDLGSTPVSFWFSKTTQSFRNVFQENYVIIENVIYSHFTQAIKSLWLYQIR